jgi:hypothetical protein
VNVTIVLQNTSGKGKISTVSTTPSNDIIYCGMPTSSG